MTQRWETQAVKSEYLLLLRDLERKCGVERRAVEDGDEPDYASQILACAQSVIRVQQRLKECQHADRQQGAM